MPLIVFEGIDGSGKTTQATLLEEFLKSCNKTVRVFRFPSRPGELHTTIVSTTSPEAKFLLFAADRYMHKEAIETEIRAGSWVICDRYVHSGNAYSGAPLAWNIVNLGMPKADATFLLECPLDVANMRTLARGSPSALDLDASLQKSAADRYDEAEDVFLVDATVDSEAIHQAVIATIKTLAVI